jgi:hypothetical protein
MQVFICVDRPLLGVCCGVTKMPLALQHLNACAANPFPSPCLRELEKRLDRPSGQQLLWGIERLGMGLPAAGGNLV